MERFCMRIIEHEVDKSEEWEKPVLDVVAAGMDVAAAGMDIVGGGKIFSSINFCSKERLRCEITSN